MIINKDNENKKLANNVLAIGQMARKAKAEDHNTMNCSVGMLYGEDSKLYQFKSVKKAMSDLDGVSIFGYGGVDGSIQFKEGIKNWLFGSYVKDFAKKSTAVVATPGGTGAIALAFNNYVLEGQTVLLPNYMWENYNNICAEYKANITYYTLNNEDGSFGVESIKSLVEEGTDKVLIIINDPCQNPTGFCMSDNDYDELVKELNSFNNKQIVLLMDVAYFDFYSSDFDLIRKRYAKLLGLNDNIMLLFAFSGSKTFGLYGLRVGALVAVSNRTEEIEAFKNASCYAARAIWSSTSALGVNIIGKILSDSNHKEDFLKEIASVSDMLSLRAMTFIEESKKVGLKLLPFERGFFVCVPTDNPTKLMEDLRLDKVFVITTKNCIRIAICSLTLEETKKLPKIIKERMEKM